MRILFSPVGKREGNGVDSENEGSLPHIVRHHMPDMVVLYLSQELIEKNRTDPIEPYLRSINPSILIEYEFREELVEVQNFDIFYLEFSEIIERIFSEHQNVDLLFNVSSGTSAMSSALLTLASFSDHDIKAVQVVDPKYAPDKSNRASVVCWPNLKDIILKDNIKRLIKQYEYSAAVQLAEQMLFIDAEVLKLIKGSAARLDQNFQAAVDYFKKTEFSIDRKRDLSEYLSMLEVRVSKNEWTDYCRALTPAITATLINLLEEHGIPEKTYSCIKQGKRYLDLQQIRKSDICKAIPTLELDRADDPILFNWHLYDLVSNLIEDKTIKDKIANIRSFEDSVRNRAAHQIIRSDEAAIRRLAQLTDKKGRLNYKNTDFALITLLDLTGTVPKLYDRINQKIIAAL